MEVIEIHKLIDNMNRNYERPSLYDAWLPVSDRAPIMLIRCGSDEPMEAEL